MSFASIVKLFVPKDRIFYGLFEEVSGTLMNMGDVFIKAVNETNPSARHLYLKSLEELEHKNDETTHRIFVELGRNFITPFDREDIHYLATSLDDIADYIWGASKRIVIYDITDIDHTLREFGDIIIKSIHALNTCLHGMRDLKDLRAITNACVLINSLENDGDDLLDRSMMSLYNTPNLSAVEIIKKKDLYQMLETVTDKCEDAANVIESIIIKYA
jgi:predicted phosphate transport protein (TIGR00153 family)